VQVGPQDAAADFLHGVQHVVVVVPVDADVDEAEHVAHEDRPQRQRPEIGPCGTLSSSTMMVMMMAMTPSLKASTRKSPLFSHIVADGLPGAICRQASSSSSASAFSVMLRPRALAL
jgi:hypothetical protein